MNQEDSSLSLDDFLQRIREQMTRRQSSPINDTSDLETVNSSMVASEAQPQWEHPQVQEDDDDEDNEEGEEVKKKNESAVDITEKFILERLNASLAADLVRNQNRFTLLLEGLINK